MDNIIEIKNLCKIYGTKIKTEVLHDISLEIKKESFTSIIGQSGSGKSTLLNIISTLDKSSKGKVIIDGVDISKLKKKDLFSLRSEKIGFIFQFHYLLPEFSCLENVLIPLEIKGEKITKEKLEKANTLLDMVGLADVKNNLATDMSGGQQQRTAIVRALMGEPSIIFADEPTGNLDTESTNQIYDLLREINKKYKTTMVIITHNREIADKADRIIEITDGCITLDITN